MLKGIAAARSSPPHTPRSSRHFTRRDSSISLEDPNSPIQRQLTHSHKLSNSDGRPWDSTKPPQELSSSNLARHTSPSRSPIPKSPSVTSVANPIDVYLRDDNKLEALLMKGNQHFGVESEAEPASTPPYPTIEYGEDEQSLPSYPASLDKGKGVDAFDADDQEVPTTPDGNCDSLEVGLGGTYISVSSNFGARSSDSGISDLSPTTSRPIKRRRRRLASEESQEEVDLRSILNTTFMRAADRATMSRSATFRDIRRRVHKDYSDRSADDEASD